MPSVLTWIVCSLETDINKHSCSASPEGTDLLALRTELEVDIDQGRVQNCYIGTPCTTCHMLLQLSEKGDARRVPAHI